MKTVCKKLLCLMLVAMMLISAVPFAFATDAVPNNLYIQIYLDGAPCTDTGSETETVEIGKTYTADEVIGFAKKLYPHYFTANVTASAEAVTVGEGVIGTVVNLTTKPCEHTNKTTTNTATCEDAGIETVVCNDCGEEISSKTVNAAGHNYVGAECTKCHDIRNAFKTITFHYMNGDGVWVSETRTAYASGEHITPPTVPANPNSGFSYWKQNSNDTGMKLGDDEVLVVNSETPTTFFAIYNKKSAMSELKIYVVRYVNGVRKDASYLYSEYFTTSNDNDMYQYLWDHDDDIVTAAIGKIGDGYTWNNKFYNYFTDEELTDANLKDNGNKSVYIKMNTKNANEAQVLLYVHKSKTSTVHDILEMDGYNKGEKVYLNDVKDFLKDEGYKWSSISSLYTDEEWDDLLDGESPSGSNHISINDNGTYKIHVILKNASQSNNADSSNPKTGDSIMIAVTTMGLAAAAMVALVELKKRKMI